MKFGGLFVCLFSWVFISEQAYSGRKKKSTIQIQEVNVDPEISSLVALTFQGIKIMQDGKELKDNFLLRSNFLG